MRRHKAPDGKTSALPIYMYAIEKRVIRLKIQICLHKVGA